MNAKSPDFTPSNEVREYIKQHQLDEFASNDLIDRILPERDSFLGVVGTYTKGHDWTLDNDDLMSAVNGVLGKIEAESRNRRTHAAALYKTLSA